MQEKKVTRLVLGHLTYPRTDTSVSNPWPSSKAGPTSPPPRSQSSLSSDTPPSKHSRHLNTHVPPCSVSGSWAFLATCWSTQYWSVPVSPSIPRCRAQCWAEPPARGNGRPLAKVGQTLPYGSNRKLHTTQTVLRKANILSSCSFCFKKKCHPLLEQLQISKNFFRQQRDCCRLSTWPKAGRINNEFPQGNCGWFLLSKSASFILMITRLIN